jgi:tetratricopeptide (TPR) repeat protein
LYVAIRAELTKIVKRKRNRFKHLFNAKSEQFQAGATVPTSFGRRWCFRFLALLIPLLVLGLLEVILGMAGYGFPTAFFLNANDDDRAMLTDNPKFGWRFFPPAIARAPQPLYLAARKPPGSVRIFVLGESAAMGDPEPAYGFARQLERLLQARHPEQKVEVVNAAMTAINSHVIRQIARDCKPREGDFWLVYAGNNEVIGPFGAGTVFGRQTPGLATVRIILALKTTRLGQLLAQLTRSASEPKNWEGLEFFLRWQVPRDSPRLKRVYASFAANLGDVADFGRRSGATVLLATVPVNLRDFPPLASAHRAGLRPEQLADWQKWFSAGAQAQAAGRFGDAFSDFLRAGEIDDDFAQLAFQRASCEMELKQAVPAETDFRLARDLDMLRFRADSRINDIIRQTATAKGIPLIDGDEEFAGYRGEDLFYDHVHLNFTGNYRLALLFAAEVEKHWPGAQTNSLPWLSEAEVARRLAYTGFDERRVGEEMRARLQQPPFNAQSNFRARDERWRMALAALSAPPASYFSNYQAAIALTPDDWLLHANFARLLEGAGDNSGAATQWAEVSRLLPHSPESWANLGRLARIAGDTGRAKNFLQKALKEQPDSAETCTEFGILEASLGKSASARQQFHSALRLQPGFSAARVSLGLLLAREGDVTGAAAEYRQALRWHTNNVEARINLANLLAAHGGTSEALTLFEQAVTLEPENPIAHYNFGRLLAVENQAAAAITNFQVALQQSPEMGEIHYELGQALARLGREAEALGEFAQAVRLKPDLADAHLNYGVALARSGRYSEAVAEFRETLRFHPQDERAQRMLDQAARSARGGGINH